MKHVLVIEESPLLREYLRLKLTENGVEASVAINGLDGGTKIRSIIPDLIIIDYHLSRQSCVEVLKEMRRNPNTAHIPAVVLTERLDQRRIIELLDYNVKKVFSKPIKIDAMLKTLEELLGIEFNIDKTPCIVEAHVNDNIIFIEIAQGLNREKLDLLRFKIVELMDLYEIRMPKILVMMSDLKLSFGDGPNLQLLLETIETAAKAKHRNVRILTMDPFVKQFVNGRKEYSDIEVVSNLQYALEGLLAELDPGMEFGEKKAEIIGDRILSSTEDSRSGSVQLKFDAETKQLPNLTEIREAGKMLRIAAVDDDFVIQELLKTTFAEIGAMVVPYNDGEDFLQVAGQEEFDLVFLDLLMPKVSGFDVLEELRARRLEMPIIVLSAVTARDAVVKSFKAGVKSYLVKPLKPEAIFKKAIEILKPTF
jgi:DNA-binding response OmpR family regulator